MKRWRCVVSEEEQERMKDARFFGRKVDDMSRDELIAHIAWLFRWHPLRDELEITWWRQQSEQGRQAETEDPSLEDRIFALTNAMVAFGLKSSSVDGDQFRSVLEHVNRATCGLKRRKS